MNVKESLEALLKTLDVWLIVFGVFVAIGVVGESIIGFVHFRKGAELQRLQTAENLAQQREIEQLRKDAAEAGKGVASADAQAKSAIATAEEARLKQREVERANAKLQLRVEQERAARVKIEERLAPRRIDDRQVQILKAEVQPLKGKKISVFVISGDPETETFGGRLTTVLQEAGVNAESMPGIIFGGVNAGLKLTIGKDRLARRCWNSRACIDRRWISFFAGSSTGESK